MKEVKFTLSEMKAYMEDSASDELKARINEAENLEKYSSLRSQIHDSVVADAKGFIEDELSSLDIPAGVASIELIYDLVPETLHFGVRASGAKVAHKSDFSTADDIVKLFNAAVLAKESNNAQPLSFMRKTLGDAHIGHIESMQAFVVDIEPAINDLYTNSNAQSLSDSIKEIPAGDNVRLIIQYSGVTPADESREAGWLDPLVKVGKVAATSGTGTGKRRPKVKPPEPHKDWTAYSLESGDAEAKKIYDAVVVRYGTDWSKHISMTNALRNAKHSVFMAEQTRQWAEHEAAGHPAFRTNADYQQAKKDVEEDMQLHGKIGVYDALGRLITVA